jgi:hypothetical protein
VQAVDQSGSEPFVRLVNSANKVEKRVIRIGVSTPNRVEVLTGLKDGDHVIVANLATFQPGESVQPKQSTMGNLKSGEER